MPFLRLLSLSLKKQTSSHWSVGTGQVSCCEIGNLGLSYLFTMWDETVLCWKGIAASPWQSTAEPLDVFSQICFSMHFERFSRILDVFHIVFLWSTWSHHCHISKPWDLTQPLCPCRWPQRYKNRHAPVSPSSTELFRRHPTRAKWGCSCSAAQYYVILPKNDKLCYLLSSRKQSTIPVISQQATPSNRLISNDETPTIGQLYWLYW